MPPTFPELSSQKRSEKQLQKQAILKNEAGKFDLFVAAALLLLSGFGLSFSLSHISAQLNGRENITLPIRLGTNHLQIIKRADQSCLLNFPFRVERSATISLHGIQQSDKEHSSQLLEISASANMMSQLATASLTAHAESGGFQLRLNSINPVRFELRQHEKKPLLLEAVFSGPFLVLLSEEGNILLNLPRESAQTLSLLSQNLFRELSFKFSEEAAPLCDPNPQRALEVLFLELSRMLESDLERGTRS